MVNSNITVQTIDNYLHAFHVIFDHIIEHYNTIFTVTPLLLYYEGV